MKVVSRSKIHSLALGCFGLLFAAGYSLMDIDFGGMQLSSAEAWSRGVAQPFVGAGLLLVVFSVFLYRGFVWSKWVIILWRPVTIAGGMTWALSRGVGTFNGFEFALLGLPVLVIWVVATAWIFRRNTQQSVEASDI